MDAGPPTPLDRRLWRTAGLLILVTLAVAMPLAAGCRGNAVDGGGPGGRAATSGGAGSPGGGGSGGQGAAAGGGGGATGGAAAANGGTASGGNGTGGSVADAGAAGGAGISPGGATGGEGAIDGSADGRANTDGAPAAGGGTGAFGTGPLTPSTVHQDVGIHDPSMIWDGRRYHLFGTGSGSTIRGSANLSQWTNVGRFLTAVPAWIPTALGQAPDRNTPWAPDISYFNGAFHVYYCASIFGKNTSVIGLATSPTLDPAAPGYGWVDQGLVIQTKATDNFNAIDPNVALDDAGVPWLTFGSFWSGIKLRRLDAATGKPSAADPTLYSIASRNGGAIEAPSIISHGGYYYLFVSFDVCCQGTSSTYRTMVGRAAAITGPYLDSAGKAMLQSGGDQLLASTGRYIGPGGGTAWRNGDNYLYVYHYYDGQGGGTSKLAVRPINFTAEGWVALGEPLFP